MRERIETVLTDKDHDDAFTEVSFLLRVLAGTVDEVLGNPAPVGVFAGRSLAAKLPLACQALSLNEALDILKNTLRGGMDIAVTGADDTADIEVRGCMVRDLLARQGKAPGDKLCIIYHHMLSGMLSHLLGRQTRVSEKLAGDVCMLEVQSK